MKIMQDKVISSYTGEELNRIHKIEKQILEEVIRVCNENNITYFTVGGTTLGAVRHKGFIPWDDDIDIGMIREDYEKFLRLAPRELKAGYVLQHFYTEKATPTYFAKVRKDNTKFVESYAKKIKMHQGVFIDIMPYDRIPKNMLRRRFYRISAAFWKHMYIAKSISTTCSATDYKIKFLGKIIRKMLHAVLMPVPKEVIYNCQDRALRKYENQKTGYVSSRGYPFLECEETDLIPPKITKFEELEVCIPADADKILKIVYGDYWKIPPVEKRVTHRPCELEFE